MATLAAVGDDSFMDTSYLKPAGGSKLQLLPTVGDAYAPAEHFNDDASEWTSELDARARNLPPPKAAAPADGEEHAAAMRELDQASLAIAEAQMAAAAGKPAPPRATAPAVPAPRLGLFPVPPPLLALGIASALLLLARALRRR